MMDKIEKTLLADLKRASKKKEIPVAALVVFNNKIIAHAHNARVSKNDVTAHAEVLAIKKAHTTRDHYGCCIPTLTRF